VGSARAPLAATTVATADRTTVRTTMATRLLPLSLPSFGRTPRSGCHQRKRPPRQPSYGPPGTAGPASATTSNATSSHPTGAGATAPWQTPTAQRGTTGRAPRFPQAGVASVSCSPTEQGDNPPPAQCSASGGERHTMALALEVPAHPANRAGPHRWISRTFAPQGHISSYKPGPAGGLRPGNDTTVTEGEGASLTRRSRSRRRTPCRWG